MIAKDKQLHLLAGFIIALCFIWFGALVALGAVTAAGIAKEIYDYFFKGTVDIWDAVATVIGGLPVCIIGGILG